MRFIDQFQIILLDMARTFMFGDDRFGDDEDFATTYRAIGGKSLSDSLVQRTIRLVFEHMCADYECWDVAQPFPPVRHYLNTLAETRSLAPGEHGLLEHPFALYEAGTIPPPHIRALQQLRQTHRLGVISDIFAPSAVFSDEFKRAGVLDLFELILFYSDHGYIKPSPVPFQKAHSVFQVDAAQVVFVGDNLKRDVIGAKKEGFSAVWISEDQAALGQASVQPDMIIAELPALLRC